MSLKLRRAGERGTVRISYDLTADEASLLLDEIALDHLRRHQTGLPPREIAPSAFAREIVLVRVGIDPETRAPRKLTPEQRAEIRARYAARAESGETIDSLAAEYGVHRSLVSLIGRGLR